MNPDLAAFIAAVAEEVVFGQVLIRRAGRGFELRHVADRQGGAETLQRLKVEELRAWAQLTERGGFRPLKSAPDLRRGWRATAADAPALGLCLNHLYPGAVADWFAAQSDCPPVTSYREVATRQTGMYRITTMLNDPAAGAVICACCHPDSCLKRRLWSVEGLRPDAPADKSMIPCLEPCVILLEFARKAARRQEKNGLAVTPSVG
ncbi:MAG: DR2241 family protein [Verrucomicrobiota bacterium]|jgi:hypothetical protein